MHCSGLDVVHDIDKGISEYIKTSCARSAYRHTGVYAIERLMLCTRAIDATSYYVLPMYFGSVRDKDMAIRSHMCHPSQWPRIRIV